MKGTKTGNVCLITKQSFFAIDFFKKKSFLFRAQESRIRQLEKLLAENI